MTQLRTSVFSLCRPEARSLPAYNAGLSASAALAKYGLPSFTQLASNENPFGASPTVAEELRSSLDKIFRYPDTHCTVLREQLERVTGVDGARIVFGNGSADIIDMLCKTLLSPGDRAVTLSPSFGYHEILPLMMGAAVDKVAVNAAFEYDLPAWCAALSRPAKLVMFSTPSNPVGCALSGQQLQVLCNASPQDAVLVVDEAYYEYAVGPHYADSLTILSAQPRPWIVLRTLSKAYGLAGLRVGYGIASDSDLVSLLEKVRIAFNVNLHAQVAAVAALRDTDHLKAVVSATVAERQTLIERLRALEATHAYGLRIAPSFGNFLFMDTGRPSRDVAADLMRNGVIVKPWLESGFETFIRVTVGLKHENDHFMNALTKILAANRESAVT